MPFYTPDNALQAARAQGKIMKENEAGKKLFWKWVFLEIR